MVAGMSIQAMCIARSCACGCGEPTQFGKIEVLTHAGHPRKRIAELLGTQTSNVSAMISKVRDGAWPRIWVHGHSGRSGRNKMAAVIGRAQFRAERQRRDANSVLKALDRARPHVRRRHRRTALAWQRQAWVTELRAANLGLLVPHMRLPGEVDLRPAAGRLWVLWVPPRRPRVPSAEEVARAILDPLTNVQKREQVDYLRNRQSESINADGLGRRVALFSTLEAKSKSGNLDWLDARLQRDEDAKENAAAGLLLSGSLLPDYILQAALNDPDRLDEDERALLRDAYDTADAILQRDWVGRRLAFHDLRAS